MDLSDEKPNYLGEMKLSEAHAAAKKRKLDLVLVNEKQKPPLCKIMDYAQYLEDEAKKERDKVMDIIKRVKEEERLKSKMKELRFRIRTDDGDALIKLNKAKG